MSKAIPREIIGSGINDKHSLPLALDVVLFVLLFPSPQICSPGNCEENRTTVYLATMFRPKLLHDVSSGPFLPQKTTGFMMPSAGSHSPYCTFRTRQGQPALVGAGELQDWCLPCKTQGWLVLLQPCKPDHSSLRLPETGSIPPYQEVHRVSKHIQAPAALALCLGTDLPFSASIIKLMGCMVIQHS